jgi:hypothetical protein
VGPSLTLVRLVGCQTFKHARAVTHLLTGGISSWTMLSLIGLIGLERP